MKIPRNMQLRKQVAKRDAGKCVDCPESFDPWPDCAWEADHEIALQHGGPDTLDNLVTRCLGHHRIKTIREKTRLGVGGAKNREMAMHSFYMDRSMKAMIEARALETGRTQADVIRTMTEYAMDHMPQDWNPPTKKETP